MRAVLLCCFLAACGPYDAAWRTTAETREVAFQIEASLSRMAREKSKECLAKYDSVVKPYRDCAAACPADETAKKPCLTACTTQFGAATKPYRDCMGKYPEALDHWIKYVRPTINSALTITVASIQLAEQSKDKNLPWLEYLKPALCAVCQIIPQWSQLLPKNVGTLSATVCKFVTAMTCQESK